LLNFKVCDIESEGINCTNSGSLCTLFNSHSSCPICLSSVEVPCTNTSSLQHQLCDTVSSVWGKTFGAVAQLYEQFLLVIEAQHTDWSEILSYHSQHQAFVLSPHKMLISETSMLIAIVTDRAMMLRLMLLYRGRRWSLATFLIWKIRFSATLDSSHSRRLAITTRLQVRLTGTSMTLLVILCLYLDCVSHVMNQHAFKVCVLSTVSSEWALTGAVNYLQNVKSNLHKYPAPLTRAQRLWLELAWICALYKFCNNNNNNNTMHYELAKKTFSSVS